jgi:hypothetical protein
MAIVQLNMILHGRSSNKGFVVMVSVVAVSDSTVVYKERNDGWTTET